MVSSDCKVSFVVITHNRADQLCDCLRSCLAQEWPNREVIVVDNASTDRTRELVQQDFPQVRLIGLDGNRGVSGGRNEGIRVATGEVCIQIDDDATFVGTDAAAQTVRYFATDARLACVGYTIRDVTTNEEEKKSIPRRDKRSLGVDFEATYFCGAGFAVRRQAFLDAGMFWETLVYGSQELDLSYRWLDHGWRILHSARVNVLHKSSPTARPMGQWVYFNTRDRPWVAARHLPWRCVFSTTALWWSNTLWTGLKRREVRPFLQGVRDCIVGFRRALKGRRVIGASVARRLRDLSGRYWY